MGGLRTAAPVLRDALDDELRPLPGKRELVRVNGGNITSIQVCGVPKRAQPRVSARSFQIPKTSKAANVVAAPSVMRSQAQLFLSLSRWLSSAG